MNNLPTAEEMASKWEYDNMNAMGTKKQGSKELSIAAFMQEFAKLHCKAQLKAILENVQISWENDIIKNAYENNTWVDEESIINAYPIDNIK